MLIVNDENLNLGLLEAWGRMMATPKNPADKLINKSDNVISQTFSITLILTYLNNLGILNLSYLFIKRST